MTEVRGGLRNKKAGKGPVGLWRDGQPWQEGRRTWGLQAGSPLRRIVATREKEGPGCRKVVIPRKEMTASAVEVLRRAGGPFGPF